jgi:hypothetical protein
MKMSISDKTRREAIRTYEMMSSDTLVQTLGMLPKEILPKYQAKQFAEALARDEAEYQRVFSRDEPKQGRSRETLAPKSMLELGLLDAVPAAAPKGAPVGTTRRMARIKPDEAPTEGINPALFIKPATAPKRDQFAEGIEALAGSNAKNPSSNDTGGAGRERL